MIYQKKYKNFLIKSPYSYISLFLYSGCKAVGPDYEGAPEMDVPENWNNQLNNEFVEDSDTKNNGGPF